MNSANWTYVGSRRQQYKIVLKHGIESGNFAIFCNKKPMIIDFDIFDSKSFSFFIEEELCQIEVIKEGDKFTYKFDVDQKADTPLNRRRKSAFKKNFNKGILVGVFSTIVIFSIIFLSFYAYRLSFIKDLKQHPIVAIAKFEFVNFSLEGKKKRIRYNYPFRYANYSGYPKISRNNLGEYVAQNGMPIYEGDEFYTVLSYKKPSNHRIQYFKPSVKQLDRYRNRAIERWRFHFPTFTKEQCECLVNVAFEQKYISGIADVYYAQVTKKENDKNNKATFKTLINSKTFKKAIKKCPGVDLQGI